MLIRTDDVPENTYFVEGSVSVAALLCELSERGSVAVTRGSLERPAHYATMEANRVKVWADNLGSIKLHCAKHNLTLYLVGPDPREDKPLWDWYADK